MNKSADSDRDGWKGEGGGVGLTGQEVTLRIKGGRGENCEYTWSEEAGGSGVGGYH